jgi:uncharacterized repeat protein (TIGR01451 family)
MRKLLRVGAAAAFACALLFISPATISEAGPVATNDATYQLCGRVFADPQAFWPSPAQGPQRSPWAKGNAACAATDFVSYGEMVNGMTYLEGLFPQFVEFYNLEQDFGDGSDCATSTNSQDLCSAGLPRQGVPASRLKSDLWMIRVTDERVADTNKRFFVFPLSIHGIERAGAEAGVRIAEDLATWGYCEAVANGELPAKPILNCAREGAIPHPLLETTPNESVAAGEALKKSAVYLIFPNPDGWRRGDPDNLTRFYQRYNGNGVDLNRDWPTIGFTYRPYTPASEPEVRSFAKVLKGIRSRWDGGIDLHGQLIDRAFSFTLLGASERDYAKNQRILQTVKGAWADAEKRLSWSPAIKPNDAPPQPDDPRMYGVQWGTVWDTIDYTVTGSLGDWIDSPLGLGADGIDNEMSLSHLSNCGTGACYLPDAEQLHVDGNKSLVYAMVNFTLLPEDTTFSAPGKVGYVFNPKRLSHAGDPTPTPPPNLPTQPPILNASLSPANNFTHEFLIKGPDDGFYNGGVEGKATAQNVGGIGAGSVTSLVLERYRTGEPPVTNDNTRCATEPDNWEEVNRYFNQSSIYLQSGQAVHGNFPSPGRWRICLTGGLANQIASSGGTVDLDITFSGEQAWEDPGQRPYDVTNMKFFEDLAQHMAPGQLVPVNVNDVLSGAVDLDQFRSVVIADDPFPGYTESIATGAAQPSIVHQPPTAAAATAPCAWPTNPVLPPSCHADYEFDVDPAFNNQQLIVTLDSPGAEEGVIENDWDLYVQRQSRITGEWFDVGSSTSGTGDERVTILTPPVGHYRARIINWAGTVPPTKLEIAFSNEHAGPPIPPSTRTEAERDAWAAKLKTFVQRGGNLVLTDGAVKNVAYMNLLPRSVVNNFTVFAGYIGFTRDGTSSTYGDPLAQGVNQPGAAEGPQHRHQTYEPVPIGYDIGEAPASPNNTSPVWAIDQVEWERAGGRTVGVTTADQVTLGELGVGSGTVRVIGALLPMPSDQYYHPFGLANYALTYTGYEVFKNALQWQRPATDLAVTKTDAPDPVLAGQQLTYTVKVTNNGPAAATGVTVSDSLPAGVTFVSATSTQGSCSGTSTITCSLGAVLAGGSATVTIKVRPTTPGTITNTASVSADGSDPSPGNNSATATTKVNPAADLSVTKTDAPDPVHIGQALVYTIKVTNNGPQTATGVTLSDTLPKGAGFGSTTTTQGTCSFKPEKRIVTCNLGTLASGATATVTITVKPTSKGTITNTASVTGSPTDPNTANNKSVATTTVVP